MIVCLKRKKEGMIQMIDHVSDFTVFYKTHDKNCNCEYCQYAKETYEKEHHSQWKELLTVMLMHDNGASPEEYTLSYGSSIGCYTDTGEAIHFPIGNDSCYSWL